MSRAPVLPLVFLLAGVAFAAGLAVGRQFFPLPADSAAAAAVRAEADAWADVARREGARADSLALLADSLSRVAAARRSGWQAARALPPRSDLREALADLHEDSLARRASAELRRRLAGE